MRICKYCKAEEEPAAPFVDGACLTCLNKIKVAKEASAEADAREQATESQQSSLQLRSVATMFGGLITLCGGWIMLSGGDPLTGIGMVVIGSVISGGSFMFFYAAPAD